MKVGDHLVYTGNVHPIRRNGYLYMITRVEDDRVYISHDEGGSTWYRQCNINSHYRRLSTYSESDQFLIKMRGRVHGHTANDKG